MSWVNYGDIGFAENGGVMVKESSARDGEYQFFQLQVEDEENKYAFYGVVNDIEDYVSYLDNYAADYGFNDGKEFVSTEPERAVSVLVENYGYGAIEFGATNANGYSSTDINDFKVENNNLIEFMESVGLPEGYYPEYVFDFENTEIKNTSYECKNGVEEYRATLDFAYLSKEQQLKNDYEIAFSRTDVSEELHHAGFEVKDFDDFKKFYEDPDIRLWVDTEVVMLHDKDEILTSETSVEVTVSYAGKTTDKYEASLRRSEEETLDAFVESEDFQKGLEQSRNNYEIEF